MACKGRMSQCFPVIGCASCLKPHSRSWQIQRKVDLARKHQSTEIVSETTASMTWLCQEVE